VQRACFTFQLREGREEEYERRHREVWPDLLRVLSESGIRNYTLFRRGRTVIAYCECYPDTSTAFGAVGTSEVNARWSTEFEDVIEELTDAAGRLLFADEVWHRDLADQDQ
jgi:L-rhamnose mutarotase